MKKFITALTVVALALAIGSTVFAQGRKGGCNQCGQNQSAAVPVDQFRKFQLDTIDLRQEMMMRRFEIQRENLKATPDTAKIEALKAEINAIQSRINSIRVQSGLPDNGKLDGECFKMDGSCFKQDGTGGCYKMNSTGGCNGPCGQVLK